MSKIKTLTDNKKILHDYFENNFTYVALDTETTGLHPKENYLIEIGAIKFNRYGILEKPIDILIKPPVEIPFFITSLTGIDDFMVHNSPCAKDGIKKLLEYLGNKESIIIAHNAPFDIHFINEELNRANMQIIENQIIDTLVMARAFHPDFRGTQEGPYKLQSLAKRYNIDIFQSHRANDDARVCMELFNKLLIEKRNNSDIKNLAKQALLY